MLKMRLTTDLVSILRAGGSLQMDGSTKLTLDLVAMATAAADSGSTLTLHNMGKRLTADLVAIARAGKGGVTLTD
jgi:hypothetical protein